MHSQLSIATAAICSALFSAMLVAQDDQSAVLAGTYTVDAIGQGPRNFRNVDEAIQRLERRGVSSTVVLAFAPGEYVMSLEFGAFEGMGETNKVTFLGAKSAANKERVVWKNNGGPAVTLTSEAKDFVFAGFTFADDPGGSAVFHGRAGSSDIEIRDCVFAVDPIGDRGVIDVEGRERSNGWHIHHNTFRVRGGDYCCYFSEISTFDIHDNVFDVDEVQRTLYLVNRNDAYNRIHHNTFLGTTDISVHVAASNMSNLVISNVFLTSTPQGHAVQAFGNQNNFNRIYGNLFMVADGGGGIYLSHGDLLHVVSDGNLFACTSGKIGTIKRGGDQAYKSLSEWRKGTAELPRGAMDENSAAVDARFWAKYKPLLRLMRTGKTDDPEVLKTALGLLASEDIGLVRLGIHALARAGRDGRKGIDDLRAMSRHSNPFVRADVAYAIGAIKATAEIAVSDLQRMLSDEEPLVVQNAARALSELLPFSRNALPKLEKLLKKDFEDHDMTRAILQRAVAKVKGK